MALKREFFKAYENSAKEAGAYYKSMTLPPDDILIRHKADSDALKNHLNQNGYKMPKPLYEYDPKNKATHRYIRSSVGHGAMLNPEYMFKDSWKINDNLMEI